MGKADVVTKEYMQDEEVFADVFNYYLYKGKTVLTSSGLKEMDTTEVVSVGQKKQETTQKYRDVLKSAVVKKDGKISYMLFGIENQKEVHYAMPVRNMIYDSLQYGKQIRKKTSEKRARKSNRSDKIRSRAAFLSGIEKEEKLAPVITLVVFFGNQEWDAPTSLHQMLEVEDPELLKYISDYRINLLDPGQLDEQEIEKFQSSFREVAGYIKYSKDKDKLHDFLKKNERMKDLDVRAARVIQAVTNTKFEIPEGKERINVCQAVDEMMEEKLEEGRSIGIKEGRSAGIKEGRRIGRTEGQIELLASMVDNKRISAAEAAEMLGMTETEFTRKRDKM